MAHSKFTEESSDIVGQACAWIAQLETGNMSNADMQAFQEWIGRSPVHYHEMRKLAQLSSDINVLTDMSGSIRMASKERQQAVRKSRRFSGFVKPALASFAVLLFTVFAGYQGYRYNHPADTFVVSTPIGGFKEIKLADGSVVKLNTASQIEVDFDKHLRRVRLLVGEAFFDVAHEPSRPFIVFADDKSVKAIGTAFAVRLTDGDLSVTVSEGKVQFAPVTEKAVPMSLKINEDETEIIEIASIENPLLLKAGQKLSLPEKQDQTKVASVRDSHVQTELAWSSGLWDFEKRPLVDVINEMNRYTDMHIEFAEAELSDVHFDGLFRTDDLEGLLEGLDLLDDIEIIRVNDNHVRIKYVEN